MGDGAPHLSRRNLAEVVQLVMCASIVHWIAHASRLDPDSTDSALAWAGLDPMLWPDSPTNLRLPPVSTTASNCTIWTMYNSVCKASRRLMKDPRLNLRTVIRSYWEFRHFWSQPESPASPAAPGLPAPRSFPPRASAAAIVQFLDSAEGIELALGLGA